MKELIKLSHLVSRTYKQTPMKFIAREFYVYASLWKYKFNLKILSDHLKLRYKFSLTQIYSYSIRKRRKNKTTIIVTFSFLTMPYYDVKKYRLRI